MAAHATVQQRLGQGRAALARGEWDRARGLLLSVLADRESAELLEELAWAGWWLADENLTISARERAYQLHRAAGDADAAGRVATWLASDMREFRGEEATGRGWLNRAHGLLDGRPECAEQGWLALTDADFALHVDHDLRAVVTLASSGVLLGRRLDVADLEAVGLGLEGLARVGLGSVEEGMHCLEEASAIAAGEEMRLPFSTAWALCCGLTACDGVGDFPRAREWCEAMRRFAERWGGRQLLGVCRTAYGRILATSGDWPAAEGELLAAVEDMVTARPGMAAPGLARLGELRARQARGEEARALFEQAGAAGLVGLGELALEAGDADGAAELAERVLRRLPERALLERLPALALLALARMRRGDLDGAARACASVDEAATAFGTPFIAGRARLLDGALAAARGDGEAARRASEDAIDCFEQSSAPYEAALAREQLSSVLRALGRIDGAARERATAERTLEALGARRDLARLRAQVPTSTGVRSDGASSALTPRELDVLRLVARGMSDMAVAEELIISRHTVHRHMANVRTKLGLPSRAAAVAYAAREKLL